jgi:hypothetical protein
MSRNHNEEESSLLRMELKYCEHCGGLWMRECGAGVVYCENCQPKVADLPLPKKKPSRVPKIPVRGSTVVEQYGVESWNDGDVEFEAAAAGGMA